MAAILASLGERLLPDNILVGRPQSIPHERATQAILIIMSRYSEASLTLHDLAAQMRLSHTYLSDVLARCSGYGFLEHLHAVRVLRAAAQLYRGSDSITQIARCCGYKREFQLARHFREYIGLSPSRFRRLIHK